jgi:DNA-binding HxlR family transcriptional regulator
MDMVVRKKSRPLKTGCAVEVTLSVIGGTWKPIILFYLLEGRRRFNELARLIGDISPRMLTVQLRELERDGLVSRHVHPVVPPHVDYELTCFGRSVEPVLMTMLDWGEAFKSQQVS